MDPISAIVSVASTLKAFGDSFVRARRDKRERLATYFAESPVA